MKEQRDVEWNFSKHLVHSKWDSREAVEFVSNTQIENEKLSIALQKTTAHCGGHGSVAFTREDWNAFGIFTGVKTGDVIKSGAKYFRCNYVAPPLRSEGIDEQIAACEAELRQLDLTMNERLATELDDDGTAAAGNYVPNEWLKFYNNVEGRVAQFLDELLGTERGDS